MLSAVRRYRLTQCSATPKACGSVGPRTSSRPAASRQPSRTVGRDYRVSVAVTSTQPAHPGEVVLCGKRGQGNVALGSKTHVPLVMSIYSTPCDAKGYFLLSLVPARSNQ